MADRHGPLRMPLGRFIERVNGGQLSKGAILTTASDVGIDELPFPGTGEVGVMPGDNTTFVVPAGARAIKQQAIGRGDLLALVPGSALETGSGNDVVTIENSENATAFVTDNDQFFPGGARAIKIAGIDGEPSREDMLAWFGPSAEETVGDMSLDDGSVVLFTGGESPEDLFGEEAESEFRPVESGESFEKQGTIFVMPGDRVIGDDGELDTSRVFDAGVAAPLSGATFTMTVLSTPDASVAGQSANPLVGMDTEEVLNRDETQRLLKRAGASDAETIEWLAGPDRVEMDGDENVAALGESAGIQTFAAVLSGADGPWRVVAHVVRVTTDDHLVVVGLHRRAVGSEAGGSMDDLAALADSGELQHGRELMRQAVERLE